MTILNLVIAIVALVIACLAYQRSGGIRDLRENTASILAKMEQGLRKEKGNKEEKEQTEKQT